MDRKGQSLIYSILVDDEPVVAVAATKTEAWELCKEDWFLDELSLQRSKGRPLYQPGGTLRARPATGDELTKYERASKANSDTEDDLFVFLIEIDP